MKKSNKNKSNKNKPGRPKGFKLSPETKAKISETMRNRNKNKSKNNSTLASNIVKAPPGGDIILGRSVSDWVNMQPSELIINLEDTAKKEAKTKILLARGDASSGATEERIALSTFQDANYRDFVYISLQRIRSIMRSTESAAGNLQDASEYADTMYLEDAHLRSVIDSHISSIIGRELVIEPSSDSPDAEKAASLIRLCFDHMKNAEGAFRDLIFAHFRGCSFAEIQWASITLQEPSGRTIVVQKPHRLIPIHPKKWRIQLVPDASRGEGSQKNNSSSSRDGEYKYVLYDEGKFSASSADYLGVDVETEYPGRFIIHSPEANIPIHRRGLWRALAFKFFQKRAMEAFMDAGAERYAWPFVYAVGPEDMSEAAMDNILAGLANISQNVNAVFENGTEIHSLSISSPQGAADLFDTRISQINRDYSKLLLGSTLVVEEGDSGSRALGDTQAENKLDRASMEARQLAATLTEQLVKPILDRNADLFDSIPPVPDLRFSVGELKEEITPDLYSFFTIDEIRIAKGYDPLPGGAGEKRLGDGTNLMDPTLAPPIAPSIVVPAAQKIVQKGGEFCVFSEDGSKNLGCYPTMEEAKQRLKEVEGFKHLK